MSEEQGLHHAHLLVGAADAAEAHMFGLLEPLGFTLSNNPDFFQFRDVTFGIDEARRLRSFAARKAVSGKKIFFIASERLTLEAQNALLKTFEDPYPDTFFFLSASEEENIVPTLRSRMMVVRLAERDASDAEEFLSMPLKKRLAFAGKFAEKERNLQMFLNDLLEHSKSKEVHRMVLEAAMAPGASRLVLEHLALVLP